MIQNDQCVQTLKGLGLTLLQARTYSALATLGKADVKTIAKASNVARQDIYRVMPVLLELGLGKKIIAKPTMYEATPIQEGLLLLFRKRKDETAELQEKTASIINNFNENKTKIASQQEAQFIITSEGMLLLKMLKKLSQKTQTSIDIITPIIPLKGALFLHPNFLRWAKKDVKIRLITQEAEDESTKRKLQASTKNRFLEIRYFNVPPNFGMHIFDNKEISLNVSDKGGWPSLWSNNPNVVKLAKSYFNELWNRI